MYFQQLPGRFPPTATTIIYPPAATLTTKPSRDGHGNKLSIDSIAPIALYSFHSFYSSYSQYSSYSIYSF